MKIWLKPLLHAFMAMVLLYPLMVRSLSQEGSVDFTPADLKGALFPALGGAILTFAISLLSSILSTLKKTQEGKLPKLKKQNPVLAYLSKSFIQHERLWLGAVFVVAVVTPFLLNRRFADLFMWSCVYGVLALSLNVVVGYAGQLNLGHVGFYAIGSYTYAIINTMIFKAVVKDGRDPLTDLFWWENLFTNFWVGIFLGGVVAALFGIALGMPTLRLRGDYLAIVTLGFGEVVRLGCNTDLAMPFTGGPNGLRVTPMLKFPRFLLDFVLNVLPDSRQGELLRSIKIKGESLHVVSRDLRAGVDIIDWEKYNAISGSMFTTSDPLFPSLVALFLLGVTVFCILRLDRSRIGLAWVAIREDEIAARAMGVPTTKMKVLAFAIGAFFAGMVGGFFADYVGFFNTENFTIIQSIIILAMVVLGGMGSIPGALLGAVLLTVLPEMLRDLGQMSDPDSKFAGLFKILEYRMLLFGLAMVLMMRFRPQGMWPSARRSLELHEEQGEP